MLAGAIIAALTDLTFNAWGYTAVLGNDVLTALYLIMVKNSPASSGLTTTGLLFYNSALSLPLLGAALALSGEPAAVAAFPALASRSFQVRTEAPAFLPCNPPWHPSDTSLAVRSMHRRLHVLAGTCQHPIRL